MYNSLRDGIECRISRQKRNLPWRYVPSLMRIGREAHPYVRFLYVVSEASISHIVTPTQGL